MNSVFEFYKVIFDTLVYERGDGIGSFVGLFKKFLKEICSDSCQ